MKRKRILIIMCFACCLYSPMDAQTDSLRSALQGVESLYNSGEYLSAEVEARRLLERLNLTDTALVTLHKYIACSLIAQGKSEIAREHFKSILVIDPDFSLDPIYTSPKILIIFNEAKQSFISNKKSQMDTFIDPLKRGITPVTYRTIVFPGWEQLHAGQTTRGSIFLGAGIATLSAGITFGFLRGSARQKYLSATLPSDIDSKYVLYNRYYKAEIGSFIAFAVVFVASEIDVFAFDHTPSVVIPSAPSSMRGTTLTFAIKF